MIGNWRITVIGGSSNGLDYSFPPDRDVLIGRSSKADVKLSEADISGRHLRLIVRKDVPVAVNLSSRPRATRHNEMEMSPEIGEATVRAGDTITLGHNGSVRIRFDEVPASDPPPAAMETDRLSSTESTRWTDSSFLNAPTAVMEEAAVSSLNDAGATFATKVSETIATRVASMTSGITTNLNDEETVLASDPGVLSGGETDTSGIDAESGKTRELETRPGDMAEILALKAALERKRKNKYVFVTVGFLTVVVILAGLWFSSRTTKETYTMEPPLNEVGKPDIASFAIRDEVGQELVAVDYPRDDSMSVTLSPDSNGVSVVSRMGRDRDVPFFLQLESVSLADELEKDLLASARDWITRAEESGAGYVFDIRVKDELKYSFFEDVFPGCCQSKSLYGVKFVSFDYKRTWPDAERTLWHGVLIYFRKGDTVFVHRREIPEFYWVRGGYRIEQDPNIAIYSNFIDSYWESPGLKDLPLERKPAELMESIREVLSKERANDWRFAKKDIDAVLVKTWRADPKTRNLAMGCLRQFREVLRTYYYGKYNAFDAAKENRDEKRMARIRKDAAMIFDDPDERYYHLVGNGEVW